MAPVSQDQGVKVEVFDRPDDAPIPDDTIVISGMSSLMPGCHNLMEFADKLYNKENLVTTDKPRWKLTHPELSQYYGKVPEMDRFDAQFFMIHYKLSHSTDAMSRKLLEQAYHALFDAGVCPTELNGKKVGVFVATGLCETEKVCSFAEVSSGILGCNRTMYANRISYWLNSKGPSYNVDASCCSSLIALEKAYEAIMEGYCEAAIVGAAKVTLHPQASIHYRRLIPLNLDGKTKCYDVNADGQTMSEAVNVIYLQKYKDARRVYAELCYVNSSFAEGLHKDFAQKYGPYREPAMLSKFLRNFYDKVNISPSSVEYIEGFGSALPETDKAELQAIEDVFCKDRSKPLLVGSVTSNMGYAEAASGTCGIIKLLLAYQKGEIAANLYCDNPRQDISALRDGRMKIVTEHQRFQRSYTALNCFSITGMNSHVLLQGHYKEKDLSRYHTDIPYLVTVSGREEVGVQKILDSLKTSDLDPEAIVLLHNIHKMRISKHMARGYGVYSTHNKKTVALCEHADYYDDTNKQLWFVYSGMGSQWAGMGAQLMRIPIFAAAIERCHKVLKPKGVDIVKIITSPDKTTFNNILNSFVGITAIQVGLTDVLHAVGLVPDKIIGHSLGEIGCAYADGSCTAEEAILLSYYRGLVSIQTPLIKGSMAAAGIGYRQISKICPAEIDIACHNGPDSSTISGPVEPMRKFVGELVSRGIFAKEVDSSNIAYHSRYIAELGPKLLNYCREVVQTPKLRSERWVSTSVRQEKWNEPEAMYSSAEYHTNHLLNPVLFEETSRLVPSGAVVVEVAPHGLLQAILKRSLPPDCRNIPLTNRGHNDNVLVLLEAIGKLYVEGYDVDMTVLYPKIEFPVSTQTRQLSHLVEWVHIEKWNLCLYVSAERLYSPVYKPIISVYDEEYEFLRGSIIEGSTMFPFAGALVTVWDTLAMISESPMRELSVQFKDIQFHSHLKLHDRCPLYLVVMLQRGSGKFEVTNENRIICEGYIMALDTPQKDFSIMDNDDPMELTCKDIYKLFYDRGYEYKGEFRSIHSANVSLTKGKLIWRNNWTTFIDGIIQLNALRQNHDAVSQPHRIKSLCIDVTTHKSSIERKEQLELIDATYCKLRNVTRCGGVIIEKIRFKDNPSRIRNVDLKALKFIPFFEEKHVDVSVIRVSTSLCIFMQIISENLNKNKIRLMLFEKTDTYELNEMISFLYSACNIEVDMINVDNEDIEKSIKNFEKCDAVFVSSGYADKKIFEILHNILPEDAFLIIQEIKTQALCPTLYKPVSVSGKGAMRMELARGITLRSPSTTAITVRTEADLEFVHTTLKKFSFQQNLVVVAPYPPIAGLKELVKQWREDIYTRSNRISMAIMRPYFNECDIELPKFDLAFNILNDDKTWGGEYYVPLGESSTKGCIVQLQSSQLGNLDSLHWIEVPRVKASGVAVTVHYASLNANDAKRATAEIPVKHSLDSGFGMDFSGVTESGELVMGLVPGGAVRGQVILQSLQSGLLWPVPKHWSLEDAATVPLPYCLAYYCFGIKKKLTKGMTVLVHGGAGALGQAAISIALAEGCRVFATVSTIKKKNFLKQLFPELPANHIGNSCDDSFRDMIMNATNGDGCNIILSCVKGQLKDATLACCAAGGTTLDMIQVPDQDNFYYKMYFMTKYRMYITVDLSSIFVNQKYEEIAALQLMVSEGIARGHVRPLSRVTYAPHDAPRAFRLLAASRHRGRVLLHLRDSILSTQPRMVCSDNSCYLLLSDTEDFIFKLADKLVSRGAKNLYFHLNKLPITLRLKKLSWEKQNVQVKVSTKNLRDNNFVLKLLKDCNRLGPVDGIFVTSENTRNNEEKTKFATTISNLDILSRKLCPTLRYFAIISEDLNSGRNVSYSRTQSNLASLSLQLNIKHFDEKEDSKAMKNSIKWRDAADITEAALLSKETLVTTYIKPAVRPDLIEEVAKMPGVVLSSAVDSTKLEHIGIDHGRAQEFCNVIEEKFNTIIPKENVPQMTIAQLKKMQWNTKHINEDIRGISAYFNHIDTDELLASADLVLMPTLIHKSIMRSDEYECNETVLCIVPGLEGHHERFRMMCERLKLSALVLQLGLEKFNETVHEMAQRLVNVIMKKVSLKQHFYLLGYEFGVLVVLEMAAILESYGLTGTVYCLGGTAEDIRAVLNMKLGGMNEEVLQNEIVQHIYTLLSGNNSIEIQNSLEQAQSFHDKVKICVDRLRGSVPYTTQYMAAVLETVFERINMARKYTGEVTPLRAKVIVLRAMLPIKHSLDLSGTITHDLLASLPYAPDDPCCPVIINKYLEPDVLEAFHNRNHCESYLLNDELYMKFSADDD